MAIQNHGIRATTREPLPGGLLVGGRLGMRFRFDFQAAEARRESHLRRSSEDVSQPRFSLRADNDSGSIPLGIEPEAFLAVSKDSDRGGCQKANWGTTGGLQAAGVHASQPELGPTDRWIAAFCGAEQGLRVSGDMPGFTRI